MKIEMGESLFYSWLRHVKECQIVQTNWKVSPQWNCRHAEEIQDFMFASSEFFKKNYGYQIYKENRSASQLLQQAECDVLGISFTDGTLKAYGIDVAFHENGLNYSGGHDANMMAVIKKCLRTAMCIRGYLDVSEAEVIFASPKIRSKEYVELQTYIYDMNQLLNEYGFNCSARIIANEEFDDRVLQPILINSENIADTSELFLRSYQLYGMFANQKKTKQDRIVRTFKNRPQNAIVTQEPVKLAEQKVGMIAKTLLRDMLENGAASSDEILWMQEKEYSRQVFHLNFPLLVKAGEDFERTRYYASPIYIDEVEYYLCSQWVERLENNDRPYLLKWIEEHGGFA